jgi:hypothetical protein
VWVGGWLAENSVRCNAYRSTLVGKIRSVLPMKQSYQKGIFKCLIRWTLTSTEANTYQP